MRANGAWLTPPAAGPALLLLNLVTANCRSCVWPTSRLRSLELLKRLASFLTDEDIINRALPFVLTALSDDMASVRAAACESLVEMVYLFRSVLL